MCRHVLVLFVIIIKSLGGFYSFLFLRNHKLNKLKIICIMSGIIIPINIPETISRILCDIFSITILLSLNNEIWVECLSILSLIAIISLITKEKRTRLIIKLIESPSIKNMDTAKEVTSVEWTEGKPPNERNILRFIFLYFIDSITALISSAVSQAAIIIKTIFVNSSINLVGFRVFKV